jgi:hypothetical protein
MEAMAGLLGSLAEASITCRAGGGDFQAKTA